MENHGKECWRDDLLFPVGPAVIHPIILHKEMTSKHMGKVNLDFPELRSYLPSSGPALATQKHLHIQRAFGTLESKLTPKLSSGACTFLISTKKHLFNTPGLSTLFSNGAYFKSAALPVRPPLPTQHPG